MMLCHRCGAPLNSGDQPDARLLCKKCRQANSGSVEATIESEVQVFEAFEVKQRRPGRRKPIGEMLREANALKPELIEALLEQENQS